jgi:hypothetical protein
MHSQSYCTRCDRASECEWGIRNWRCPFCGGAPRSRNDRATVEALCRQWAALSFPEVNRKFHQYGAAHIAARIGTIDDLESIATMALLGAARCFDKTRGFAFSTRRLPHPA